MRRGTVFDIARFSLHDGPGIRSVVFLKGCPLRCVWCHNPESQTAAPQILAYPEKCIKCGCCVQACPVGAIRRENSQWIFDRARCTGCGKCAEVCFSGALSQAGRGMTVDEVLRVVRMDQDYYGATGGVTLSGGEPLTQPEFCAEILRRLQQENIHTAIETCCHVPWRNLEAVLPYTGLFLVDFKCADPEKHRRFTGVDNGLILNNLRRLPPTGKPVEIRMIMVPGLNMAESDIRSAGRFLESLPAFSALRLIPYYSIARSKFAAAGRPDTMPDAATPDAVMLKQVRELLGAYIPETAILLPEFAD